MNCFRNSPNRIALLISLFGLILLVSLSAPALAQSDIQVSLGTVSTFNNVIAEVPLQVTGNGKSRGLQVRLNFDDSNINSVELSDCLDGFVGAAELGTRCSQPNGQPGQIRILLNAGPGQMINDFTGVLRFQLNGTLPVDEIIPLVWDNAFATATNPAAGASQSDGMIISEGPSPGELALDAASIDFGEIDFDQAVLTTVTVANAAAAGAQNVKLDTLAISGDSDFSITDAGTCSSGTILLAQGAGCAIEIRFQPNGVGIFDASLIVTSSEAQSEQVVLAGEGTPAPAKVFLNDLRQVYTGNALSPTITTSPSGLDVVVTYDDQPNPPNEIGTYLVEVRIVEANYIGSDSALFSIVGGDMFHDRFEK